MVHLGPIPLPNLSTRLGEVVRFLQGKDYVTWPKPVKIDRSEKNTTSYCEFYKDVCHITEACGDLRKEIHNLI